MERGNEKQSSASAFSFARVSCVSRSSEPPPGLALQAPAPRYADSLIETACRKRNRGVLRESEGLTV